MHLVGHNQENLIERFLPKAVILGTPNCSNCFTAISPHLAEEGSLRYFPRCNLH